MLDRVNISEISEQDLIKETMRISENSFSQVSDFCVSASLVAKSGKIYTGTNWELKSLLFTMCAERAAFTKALSDGEREFEKIYLYGHKRGLPGYRHTSPCGICRQVMNELCSSDFKIYMIKDENDIVETTLGELVPNGFNSKKQ